MPDSLDELEGIYSALRTEIVEVLRVPEQSDGTSKLRDPATLPPSQRRFVVRAVFSMMEAICFQLKQMCLESPFASRLTPGEMALARDEDFEVDDRGEVATRSARIRFLSNLRFAFRVVVKSHDAPFALDTSGSGWAALQAAVKVRDRVTHPKRVSDLDLSDEEIRRVVDAFRWFDSQVGLLLVNVIRGLRGHLAAALKRFGQ